MSPSAKAHFSTASTHNGLFIPRHKWVLQCRDGLADELRILADAAKARY